MQTSAKITPETRFEPLSGWPILIGWFAWLALAITLLTTGGVALQIAGGVSLPLLVLLLPGFFVVEPNLARVLVLFGNYRGSVLRNGFFWTNPFTMKRRVSLRAHNLDSDKIKVNDLLGNPIEISAVVVWRVMDTARATFDVVDYHDYVQVQSDAALRNLASDYPYDKGMTKQEVEITLRANTEEVAAELERQLSARLEAAGIEVIEARLNHLAYAPEIASAMLQRQQAKAIVAARKLIVEGAVGMVEMALDRLSEKEVVTLDDERKATLVGNLLVVLCGQADATPVINTGSLYN